MRHGKKLVCAVWLTIGLLVTALPLWAGSILSGSVSYDAVTKLYTYSYSLDNTNGPIGLNELGVRIHSTEQISGLMPTSHTDPTSWAFYSATSGTVGDPPLNEFGTIWAWHGWLPVGDSQGGFSFSIPVGPTSSTSNNYFLYSGFYNGGPPCCTSIVEYGHIVAPDLAVPEPSSLMLIGTGLLTGIGIVRRRLIG